MASVINLIAKLVFGVDLSHAPTRIDLIIGDESPEADHSVDAGTVKENAEPEPSPSEPVEAAKPREQLSEESQQQIGELLASLERRK